MSTARSDAGGGAAAQRGRSRGARATLVTGRARAAARVEDLRRELAGIEESTAASPDDEHDAEGSTVAYERARVAALLAAAQTSLGRLDAALARLRAGDYGRCSGCGEAIPAERLAALPASATCVQCASGAQAPGGPRRQDRAAMARMPK